MKTAVTGPAQLCEPAARDFFAMPQKVLIDLPADVVQHILVRIQLAHHIARAAPTCKVVSVAVRNAIKVRKFSSKVVTLARHTAQVLSVAAVPDGRIITHLIGHVWPDGTFKCGLNVWRDGTCERASIA